MTQDDDGVLKFAVKRLRLQTHLGLAADDVVRAIVELRVFALRVLIAARFREFA